MVCKLTFTKKRLGFRLAFLQTNQFHSQKDLYFTIMRKILLKYLFLELQIIVCLQITNSFRDLRRKRWLSVQKRKSLF